MGIIEAKKAEKRQRLLDSAYNCFLENGISGTSIHDICKGAGIAKGTFYLYFRDMEDIAKALNIRITESLLQESFQYMCTKESETFADRLVVMAEYLMDCFEKDKDLIRIIRRDFSWPFQAEDIISGSAKNLIPGYEDIEAYARINGRSMKEVLSCIFCLVAMIISVSYDAIIENKPASPGEMRPVLFGIIRASFPEAS